MKRLRLIGRPTRLTDLSFDDLYEDIARDWQLRAQELQERRWRKLRRELA